MEPRRITSYNVCYTKLLRLRGKFLLAGALGFILYTYMTMAFGAHFNALFPVYAALMGLSLYALILVFLSFDLAALPSRFGPKLPKKSIAGLLFFAALFLV